MFVKGSSFESFDYVTGCEVMGLKTLSPFYFTDILYNRSILRITVLVNVKFITQVMKKKYKKEHYFLYTETLHLGFQKMSTSQK